MGFFRQTWTLCRKNLLIVAWRQWLSTALRAVILPIAFIIFLGYVRTFFLPPSRYGVGSPHPIPNILTEVFPSPPGGRRRVVFVNNGITTGQIPELIDALSGPLTQAGADVHVVNDDIELSNLCRSSLRGTSGCYAAASFVSSPFSNASAVQNQWTYTVVMDFALGFEAYVDRDDNDAQRFTLAFMQYIDSEIAVLSGTSLPQTIDAIPYTRETQQQRDDRIQALYMRALGNYLAAAFFLGMCGITFHLPGFIASERELGMSQLIDSMIPNTSQLSAQVARLMSAHIAFDLVYLPSWISIGAILSSLVFVRTSAGITIPFHILAGLALCSYSAFGASFFRRSQLSGITVLIIGLALAVVAQLAPLGSDAAVYALSFLFPSAAYVFFLTEVASQEELLRSVDLSETSYNSIWNVPGQIYFVALAVQIVCFPLLALLVERLRFGSSSKGRSIRTASGSSSAAIKLTGFSKHYNSGSLRKKHLVKAVKGMDLTVLNGETMVLLGANGSGKSTTLDTIAGIISPTSGLIEVDGSGGIGLCPQKNVMWGNLTVREHVSIFDQLKANPSPSSKAQLDDLIRGCDLNGKFKKRAGALSGGQKRKLQLAMAFAGGSTVCCIDEVSSGLDPLSRRKIWDILIEERGKRTFLLTTHALDEADALADHITIMSKGHLKAQGSVVELKNAHGGGYRVHVPAGVNPQVADGFNAVYTVTQAETFFQVASSREAARLVEQLKRNGVRDYLVNGPTIEDVFLKVAEEGKDELSTTPRDSPRGSLKGVEVDVGPAGQKMQLAKGEGRSVVGQTWVLFKKRCTIIRRNYLPYLCVLLVPILVAGLATYFLIGFSGLTCAYIDVARLRGFITLLSQGGAYSSFRVGPPSSFVPAQWTSSYANFFNGNRLQFVDNFNDFENLRRSTQFRRVPIGGMWLGDAEQPNPTLAFRIDQGIYWAAFAKQVMDSYYIGTTLDVRFSTFALPIGGGFGDSLQLIIYFGLAMSVYPAFFSLYPTFERLRNIRALHYSNGIHAGSLWLAYLLFDLVFILVVSVVSIAMFVGITNVWFAPGYLFVVMLLFGIASTLLSYVISLFASSQLAAFAFSAGGQAVFLLIYFIAYLGLVSFSLPENLFKNLNIVQFTLGLVTPSGNLLRALLLALNQSQLLCRDQSLVSYPGDITVYGGPILYLTLQIFGLYAFLVLYDNDWRPRWFVWRKQAVAVDQEKMTDAAVQEVLAEITRTENSSDALRVLHLNKSFGKEAAVQDLTFGVQHGEVFALLGPNGAGKSTTISLIRGDLRPTTKTSDILVEDISVIQHRTSVRRNLGVCPQFDAIDRMTVREHLSFYAQACGVTDVKQNVEKVIAATGLGLFANRMADQLSGGNKRKLSLGISIIGNPSVLLLDEPSSGMDAISKRIMWKLLNDAVKQGRSLVLTTHSMEEASALCDRAGIMAKRMLAVGTTDHLRSAHGNGYYVHIVHRNAPSVTNQEGIRIHNWMKAKVPGARSIGSSTTSTSIPLMLHGQLRYHVPTRSSSSAPSVSLGDMLSLLENNKEDLGIGFYSVSPTTLEDVFLNIVGSHGVEEEEVEEGLARVRTLEIERRVSNAGAEKTR